MRRRWGLTCLGLIIVSSTATANHGGEIAPAAPRVHLRQPVSLALSAGRLYIANRKGGTLSRIGIAKRSLLKEKTVGHLLSDLVMLSDGRLLITDEKANEVIVVRDQGHDVAIQGRLQVATSPVNIVASMKSDIVSVASLWARRITLLDTQGQLEVIHTIDLPFAPRMQCFLPGDERLLVAGAFGGRLSVIDVRSGEIVTHRELEGHNIRGLALGADANRVVVAHQMMISWVPTTENRISWGQVVSNLVRSIRIDELLADPSTRVPSPVPTPIAHWVLEPLGEHKNAAGDPGQIAVTDAGQRIACLSGVNQVAIAAGELASFQRIDVGRRPTDLVVDHDTGMAFVANTLDDSVSVLDINAQQVVDTISLGRMPKLSLAARGERFFYDAKLSLDGWYSCHSCHPDGHTTGMLNDNLSDGTYGTPKRILSLLGTNDTGPWGWNGSHFWLNDQVATSLKTTMRHIPQDDRPEYASAVSALTDYLRSFQSPPSLLEARGEALNTPQIARGEAMFHRLQCDSCHTPSVYTSQQSVDVGIADEMGQSEFNPPSLLGVSQRDAWLHDSRATRLRDVFTKHGHPNQATLELSSSEVDDLVRYLESL